MKSIADKLPPEIARQIHTDWRKNEAGYWAVRDQLLSQYQGRWIGFADGGVIASGASPVEVLHAAQQSGRHPFVTCVGREEEPCRIRRALLRDEHHAQRDDEYDDSPWTREELQAVAWEAGKEAGWEDMDEYDDATELCAARSV